MGKSRGGKYPHKGRKGKGDEEDDEEELAPVSNQRATVGMLPPSDSEEEEEEEGQKTAAPAEAGDAAAEKPAASTSKAPAPTKAVAAGDDDSDSDEDDSDSDSDDAPEYLRAAPAPRPKKAAPPQEKTAEEVRKDLERLELIRKKREDDRLRRVAAEGWDRFAPVTETNRPPGTVPSDHPDKS